MTTERRRALLVVGALVAFTATRLALVWRFPPHMDEGLFAHWAQLGYEDPAQRFLPLASGNTPMQEWLGMSLISIGIEPLTSLRVLSLLSGLVLLAVVWSLARELGGTPAAVASLLVWVVLPFSLVYGVIGLTDPIVAACFGVALVLQLRLVRKPRLDTALVLGIVWGIGLLTKLTMTSSLWLAPLGLLVFDWRRESLASRLARWIATLLLAGAIAAALYQVLRLSPLYEGADEARDLYFSNHGIREFLDSPGTWIEGNWTSYRLAYRGYLTVPLVLAGAVGAGLAIRRKPALGLFFVGWATLPVLAIVALADGAYVRWLYLPIAPLAALVAVGLAETAALVRRRLSGATPTVRTAAVVATVLMLVLPAIVWDLGTLRDPVGRVYPGHDDVDYVRDFSAGGPWPAVARMLETVPGSARVATTGQGFDYLEVRMRTRPLAFEDVGTSVPAPMFVFGIENKHVLRRGPGVLSWRTLEVFPRPRGGVPVRVRDRVVALPAGDVADSPSRLEALLGGHRALVRFVALHPEVRLWARAWRRAHGVGVAAAAASSDAAGLFRGSAEPAVSRPGSGRAS